MDTLTKHVQKIAIYVHVIRIWASHGHENPACPEQIENPELSRRGRRAYLFPERRRSCQRP